MLDKFYRYATMWLYVLQERSHMVETKKEPTKDANTQGIGGTDLSLYDLAKSAGLVTEETEADKAKKESADPG